MLKRVKLFCDWDNDSRELLERLKDQSVGFVGDRYNELFFVTDNSYDHAVVFNFPLEEITSPSKNNIALVLEPPEMSRLMHSTHRIKLFPNLRNIYSFVEDPPYETVYGLGFSTVKHSFVSDKVRSERMCMIVSDKIMTPYHVRRHSVKKALLKTDLPIAFYGRGLNGGDKRIHGEIPPMRKGQFLSHYEFCIDFENSYNAVTDKYYDPVFCGTVPINNSPIIDKMIPNSAEIVDFDDSIDSIVDRIIEVYHKADAEDYDLAYARKEITEGQMSLVKWIEKTLEG